MPLRCVSAAVRFMTNPPLSVPKNPSRIGLVILAAGASRRMGRPKQLLPIGNKSLLEHAVDAALDSAAWPVVVVLGAHAGEIRPVLARRPVLIAENAAWAEGMASSLRAGLSLINAFSPRIEGVVFALCDQPAFSTAIIDRLVEERHRSGCRVVAARYGGHLGAPVLFDQSHFPALSALVGDEGARKLLATLPPDDIAALHLPELGQDLDTPEDYAGYHPSST